MLQRDCACVPVGLGWASQSQSGVEALTVLRGQGVVKDRGPDWQPHPGVLSGQCYSNCLEHC